MTDTYAVNVTIPIDLYQKRGMPDANNYIRHALRAAKREMVDKMLDLSWHGRYWVIRFDETLPEPSAVWQAENGGMRTIDYRLTMRISEAQTERILLPDIAPLDYYAMPKIAIIEKVKNTIRRLWR